MRKFITLIVVVLISASASFSQNYFIEDGNGIIKNVNRPCVTIKFEPDAKTVKKAWKDYLKKKFDLKSKNNKGENLKIEQTIFSAISEKMMDIYTNIETSEENKTEMKVFMSFGYDIFLNRYDHPQESQKLKTILKEFSVSFLREYYRKDLEKLNKELEKLQKEKKTTVSDNERMNKEIVKNKETIVKLTEKNTQNDESIKKNILTIEQRTKDIAEKTEKIRIISEKIKGIK